MPALIRIPVLLVAALMVSGASGQDNASPGLDALLSRAADARSLQQLDRMMAEIEALTPVPDLLPPQPFILFEELSAPPVWLGKNRQPT